LVNEGKLDLNYNKIISIEPESIYIYKVFTKKNYRKKGIMKLFYDYIVKKYSEKGYKTIYVTIVNNNTASISAHKKIGFVSLSTIYTLKLFSYSFSFLKPNIFRD